VSPVAARDHAPSWPAQRGHPSFPRRNARRGKSQQESSAFLKKSAQKTFTNGGRWSGQTLATPKPGIIRSFFAAFFAKKEVLAFVNFSLFT
jgi:hypothetical protein